MELSFSKIPYIGFLKQLEVPQYPPTSYENWINEKYGMSIRIGEESTRFMNIGNSPSYIKLELPKRRCFIISYTVRGYGMHIDRPLIRNKGQYISPAIYDTYKEAFEAALKYIYELSKQIKSK